MRFPLLLHPAEEGGFTVTFPDVPEAITQGENEHEALANGLDALITALDFYFEDRRPVPTPSPVRRNGHAVELPASVAAKVLLLNQMIAAKLRPVDLAQRMGVSRQQVNRLLDLHHTTKIDSVENAVRATGKRLEVSVS